MKTPLTIETLRRVIAAEKKLAVVKALIDGHEYYLWDVPRQKWVNPR